MNPLVSIVVPTYNSERILEFCLRSLVNQSYNDIEIIVVDGFSREKLLIAERYHSSDAGAKTKSLEGKNTQGATFIRADLKILAWNYRYFEFQRIRRKLWNCSLKL